MVDFAYQYGPVCAITVTKHSSDELRRLRRFIDTDAPIEFVIISDLELMKEAFDTKANVTNERGTVIQDTWKIGQKYSTVLRAQERVNERANE